MLGKIVFTGLNLVKTSDQPNPVAALMQERQLRKLLHTARKTAFGRHYQFPHLLKQANLGDVYRRAIPPTDYDTFYREWTRFSLEDQPNITWPGIIPYYALSSGTSGAASKYVPVSEMMLSEMKKGARRMFFDLAKFNLPSQQIHCPMLMVGSSTALTHRGKHVEGDLSGIIGLNRPFWMSKHYCPGRGITDLPEWHQRIEAIVKEAPHWDIGYVVGNPAWVQMIFEQTISKYNLKNIHEIWPNFRLYAHGGVFFEPYRPQFERQLGMPVHYLDSYMASEGFVAYQNRPGSGVLRLMPDAGIYFEFVPFNSDNFDENGNIYPHATTLTLAETQQNQEYALLISTCSGLWRYLLGDTIQFTDMHRLEFRLTGRTKEYLSVCGEHLSVDNLNEAIRRTDGQLNAGIREFTVGGVPSGNQWAHQWYISADNPAVSAKQIATVLDEVLCRINDDYAVERRYAIESVRVKLVPHQQFYQWLSSRGKFNGQAKIPRVMRGRVLEDWANFGG